MFRNYESMRVGYRADLALGIFANCDIETAAVARTKLALRVPIVAEAASPTLTFASLSRCAPEETALFDEPADDMSGSDVDLLNERRRIRWRMQAIIA